MHIRTIVIFFLLSLILLTGCMGETEEFIQGTWEYNSDHLLSVAGENHLTIIWFFAGGNFSYQACCFNIDTEVAGRYRILDVEEDMITIELFNTRGTAQRFNTEIRIELDRGNETLTIQGAGPFYKLGPG